MLLRDYGELLLEKREIGKDDIKWMFASEGRNIRSEVTLLVGEHRGSTFICYCDSSSCSTIFLHTLTDRTNVPNF